MLGGRSEGPAGRRRGRRACALGAIAVAVAFSASAPAAPTNLVSTVAGNGTQGSSGDGGPATSAQLNLPTGITVLSDGGYLIADQESNEVRRVFPDGHIATIAGSGPAGFSGDNGPATAATMNAPSGAAMTADGTVLIADSNNNRVRAVSPDGTIRTVVGNGSATFGGDGGPAANAQVRFPFAIAVQADGGYLIADVDNARVRRVAPDGTITTVAGNGTIGFGGDGGPATSASLDKPSGVAVAPDGGFLIGDTSNNRVRRVAPGGTITTVAGTGMAGDGGDGGPATSAQLNQPIGVTVAGSGAFAIADRNNNKVKLVDANGTIRTVAGTGTAGFNGDGALGTATQLNQPIDVGLAADGDPLIADTFNNRIRRLDSGELLPASLTLAPAQANRTPGDLNVVTATVRGTSGAPFANATIRYSVAGPNPRTGTATTDARGMAAILWDGVHVGTDVLSAFVDSNGNGVADAGEPTATATVVWSLPAPTAGRTFNIEPVSGVVKIRIIGGHAKAAHAAAAAFTPLTHAAQLPLTTEVDVTQGRVQMTVAGSGGQLQRGDFYQGVYRTTQPRAGKQITTEVKLSTPLACGKSGKLAAARARSRHLWADVHGHFRTRGRNSTATVRGTLWLTKDTCTSTLTVVRRGSVVVNDLAKHKTVVVKAGKRYLARTGR